MKNIILIIFFITSYSFSQTLETKFIRSGFLTDKPTEISKSKCEFKKNKKVEVLEYIANNWWRVRVKNCTGYVTSSSIIISDELIRTKEIKILKVENDRTRKKDSIKFIRDSILKMNKIIERKRIVKLDSIKNNILNYSKDSLLITKVEKNSKLKKEPEPLGEIILEFNTEKKVVVLDYVDYYFKVCIDSTCGFMSEMYFNTKGDTMESILIKEFQKVKEEENRLEKINEREKEKTIAKYTYINDCLYDANEKDEFTGIIRKNTIVYNLNNLIEGSYSKVRIQLKKYGKNKYVVFSSFDDLGCSSPYSTNRSTVKIKLENNDIVNFYHMGDLECGNFILVGKINANEIIRLKKSPIKTIRITGTKYYQDYKNFEFKDFFIKKLDCIK